MLLFRRLDYLLICLAIGSSLLGIFTLYGGSEDGESMAIRNLIWLIISIGIMLFLSYVNYQQLGSYALIIYGVCIALLLLTLIPVIGSQVKGARSWLRVGNFGFQPAEFTKLAVVIALSKYLVIRETEIEKFKELFIPFVITIVPMLLIALQPDLGYAVLMMPLLMILLYIGGANASVIIGLVLIGFTTLFIPMYIEYQNYMLNDELYTTLKETHYKIADAVRILNFELWSFLNNPGTFKPQQSSNLITWAITTLREPENLKILNTTIETVRATNINYLRDFLASNTAMVTTIISLFSLYGLSSLAFFMTRNQIFRKLLVSFLISALALTAAFGFQKLVKLKPHQVIRVVSFANPEKFQKGAGYQLRHSLITLGSGELFGKGAAKGEMTKGNVPFLPEWFNDFIFSVIGEQFGFFGAISVMLMLFGIVIRGAYISIQSKDDFGSLLAAGITTIFFLHTAINIGISMGILPVTGLPLSFVSHGGSNMLVSYAALGILLNINKRRFINA